MIYEVSPINSYCGNNSSTTFDFDFYIENENELEVYLIKNSEKQKLILNVDYEIFETKNKNGSYITYPVANSTHGILSTDEKISLELSLRFIQEIEYNNSSLLNLESIEHSFDYLTRLTQILKRKLDNCLQVEEGSFESTENIVDIIKDAAAVCAEATALIKKLPDLNDYLEEIGKIQDYADTLETILELAPQIQNAMKKDCSNSLVPYVKRAQRSTDNKSYYRLWSDNFLEEYMILCLDELEGSNVVLPLPYADSNYNIFAKTNDSSSPGNNIMVYPVDRTKYKISTAGGFFSGNPIIVYTMGFYGG